MKSEDRLEAWRNLDRYTLVEAALLITENYPDDFTNLEKLLESPPHDFLPIYSRLLFAAVSELGMVESGEDGYEGKFFMENRLNTDKPESCEKIPLQDGGNIHVSKVELLRYIKRYANQPEYKITARFFTDETLTEFNRDIKAMLLPIKESARKTDNMLRALAAIAIDAYGYEPNANKSTAPADIAKALSDKGAIFDEKTIRGWLKEGAELLEPKADKS